MKVKKHLRYFGVLLVVLLFLCGASGCGGADGNSSGNGGVAGSGV